MKIICIALKYNVIQMVKFCQFKDAQFYQIKNLRLHFGILQIVYHKLVHLQIGMSPLIGCKPCKIIVGISDNNLIFIVQTNGTNCYNLLIAIHNDTIRICIILFFYCTIEPNVTPGGVVRQNFNNLGLCSLFKCCILL